MANRLFDFSSVTTASARLRRCLLGLTAAAVAVLMTACASGPAAKSADDLRAEARIAFLAQDYQRTLSIVEAQAITGAPWAQYTLGYMYYYGRGIVLDRARAREWIQQAADQGYAPAKEALRRLRPPPPVGTDVIGNNTATSAPQAAAPRSAEPPATTAPPGASTSTPAPAPSTAPGTATATAPSAPATSDTLPTGSPGAAENPAPPLTAATPREAGEPPLPAPAPPVTEQGGITKNTALPPNAPASGIAPTDSTVPPPADDVRNNAWVTAQDAQRYTLQLVGSSDRNAAIRYIRDRGLTNDAAYYATSRDGQPWYVVIYGNYADRDAAQAALLHLPPTLRAASPWIRQFGDIQTDLAAP